MMRDSLSTATVLDVYVVDPIDMQHKHGFVCRNGVVASHTDPVIELNEDA